MKKPAFTLAEIMIVLTVIGILVAILLPSAQNAIPKEDMMKFKKVNNNLARAINELVTSEKYYSDGDLGLKANGSLVDSPKYFCNTLADVLSVKSVNCLDTNLGYNSSAVANLPDILSDEIDGEKIYQYADCMCSKNVPDKAEIVLSDDTAIYTINPYWHFGSKTNTGSAEEKRLFNLCSDQKRYKFICVDIDGLNQGEAPFGYALRADGKIIYGAKANAWIKASVQAKDDEDELTIATLDSCSPSALSIVPENDVCKSAAPAPSPSPEPEPEPKPCGDYATKVTFGGVDYCVTKYNIGDAPELTIPDTVTVANVDNGESCSSSSTTPCCWSGTTSTTCDTYSGDYSGCNRTLCDWWASMESCSKLTYLGKTWRLLSQDDVLGLIVNVNGANCPVGLDQGNKGIMLCNKTSNTINGTCKMSQCEVLEGKCLGANYDNCYPYSIWTSGVATAGSRSYYGGVSGALHNTFTSGNNKYAFSTRCITEL